MYQRANGRAFGLAVAIGCVLLALPGLAYTPDAAAPRSSIPTEYQWQWGQIFPTIEAWEAELAAFDQDIPKLMEYQGRLGESKDTLKAAQQQVYEMLDRFYRLMVYAQLRFDINQGDNEARTWQGRVQQLGPKFGQATSWMQPELLTIPRETIEGWLASDPDIAEWRFYFEEMWRQAEHTLDADGERLMATTGRMRGTPSDAHEALLSVDIEFPEIVGADGLPKQLTLNNFSTLRASPTYAVRKQAAESFFGTLRSYENTFSVLLDGVVKSHIASKEARGYESCLQTALSPDNISEATYQNLIATVRENLPKTLHKYIALRKKVLGLETPLDFANLYNPLLEDVEKPMTYDEAMTVVAEGLRPLGKEYVDQAKIGMDPQNGWTDVYPNEDKRSGAYSNGVLAHDLHPFVLQNFDNTLDAMYTTAHEYGHAMHSWYSSRNQPAQYRGYTTFLAEVASTCNEALVTNYLLKKYKDDPEMTLMLLNQRLESMRLTIFRQTLFADFELAFHAHAEAGNPLTAEWLNAKYKELIELYYGPEYEMAANDECEWMFIPHFYYDFYVFSYATGLCSGLALAENISAHGEKPAQQYIDGMLKAGSSAPPLDILRTAGVDLETPAPIQSAMDLFAATLAEFERTWIKANKQ
ncbi:MAG TPA: oligoendopeptidase F [Candidatus Krumholzibacteria bacterium]|nr:oligoendopeptidase F [Candidatus Krumholzibacteria bacterium]HPD71166.1 oligoendopeptidase F [Candidatus Krumholzibacteria bacterium]HRY39134.1 oligoendopeptidase F [Candidatus Krumholzibacteria bacterium]